MAGQRPEPRARRRAARAPGSCAARACRRTGNRARVQAERRAGARALGDGSERWAPPRRGSRARAPGSTPSSRTTSRRVDSEGVRISRAPRATTGIRLEVRRRFLSVWNSRHERQAHVVEGHHVGHACARTRRQVVREVDEVGPQPPQDPRQDELHPHRAHREAAARVDLQRAGWPRTAHLAVREDHQPVDDARARAVGQALQQARGVVADAADAGR